MRLREPAICLRAIDYSETSQVLRFITRGAGIVGLVGKGTKRPKSKSGGAIDLMAEGDLVFTTGRGEGLGILVEFSETVSRLSVRRQAGRLNAGLYAVELVGEMLAEHDPHPEVFDLLHSLLLRLAEPHAPVPAVLAYFQWRLLRHVGLLGQMDRCVSCGALVTAPGGGDVYFSSADGGLLCRSCELTAPDRHRVDSATTRALVALASAEAGRKTSLPPDQARAANRLLDYHVTEQLGKRLKMARHVVVGP